MFRGMSPSPVATPQRWPNEDFDAYRKRVGKWQQEQRDAAKEKKANKVDQHNAAPLTTLAQLLAELQLEHLAETISHSAQTGLTLARCCRWIKASPINTDGSFKRAGIENPEQRKLLVDTLSAALSSGRLRPDKNEKPTQQSRRGTPEATHIPKMPPVLSSTSTSDLPPSQARFHVTPKNGWERFLQDLEFEVGTNCVHNHLEWTQSLPLPPAPKGFACWLLPCRDVAAVEIARHQDGLRALGWKLLTCEPHVVSRIGQKANLYAYAKSLELLQHLPRHYSSPECADYPCMLKSAVGEFGASVFIVHSAAEVHERVTGGFHGSTSDGDGAGVGADADAASGSSQWLLQEIASGHNEYATSLLVKDGEILDAITTSYEFEEEVYVWPHVTELKEKRHSHTDTPDAHLATMKAFLSDFSGICNFNYKTRPSDGGLCIFEVNARIGSDLACDVPRPIAAQLFSKLRALDMLTNTSNGTAGQGALRGRAQTHCPAWRTFRY
jgi:hypothetical protein